MRGSPWCPSPAAPTLGQGAAGAVWTQGKGTDPIIASSNLQLFTEVGTTAFSADLPRTCQFLMFTAQRNLAQEISWIVSTERCFCFLSFSLRAGLFQKGVISHSLCPLCSALDLGESQQHPFVQAQPCGSREQPQHLCRRLHWSVPSRVTPVGKDPLDFAGALAVEQPQMCRYLLIHLLMMLFAVSGTIEA